MVIHDFLRARRAYHYSSCGIQPMPHITRATFHLLSAAKNILDHGKEGGHLPPQEVYGGFTLLTSQMAPGRQKTGCLPRCKRQCIQWTFGMLTRLSYRPRPPGNHTDLNGLPPDGNTFLRFPPDRYNLVHTRHGSLKHLCNANWLKGWRSQSVLFRYKHQVHSGSPSTAHQTSNC